MLKSVSAEKRTPETNQGQSRRSQAAKGFVTCNLVDHTGISILEGVDRAFDLLATDRRREAIALFQKHAIALAKSSVRLDDLQREIDAAGTDFN